MRTKVKKALRIWLLKFWGKKVFSMAEKPVDITAKKNVESPISKECRAHRACKVGIGMLPLYKAQLSYTQGMHQVEQIAQALVHPSAVQSREGVEIR